MAALITTDFDIPAEISLVNRSCFDTMNMGNARESGGLQNGRKGYNREDSGGL